MIVALEPEDYVAATQPFRNGCSFRAVVKRDGSLALRIGCYCLVNLLQGAEAVLYERIWGTHQRELPIAVPLEARAAILKTQPCAHCGGLVHEA
jgi:hypothetical protein